MGGTEGVKRICDNCANRKGVGIMYGNTQMHQSVCCRECNKEDEKGTPVNWKPDGCLVVREEERA